MFLLCVNEYDYELLTDARNVSEGTLFCPNVNKELFVRGQS